MSGGYIRNNVIIIIIDIRPYNVKIYDYFISLNK